MRCSEQFHWQLKTVLRPGEESPLFRRVSRCVRFFSESRVCVPAFGSEGKRGPFVREVEKRDQKRFETAL